MTRPQSLLARLAPIILIVGVALLVAARAASCSRSAARTGACISQAASSPSDPSCTRRSPMRAGI